jgi:hypothetical protein
MVGERYARIGDHGRMLHETRIFSTLDLSRLGGCLGVLPDQHERMRCDDLPVLRGLADRLVTLPPFTRVSERFVRECASALRKVTACAVTMDQHRPRGSAAPQLAEVGPQIEVPGRWFVVRASLIVLSSQPASTPAFGAASKRFATRRVCARRSHRGREL